MEREIIFRGKRIDNGERAGEWVDGDLISNAFTRLDDGSKCCYILNYSEIDYQDFKDVFEMLDEFEVDPETVGQYTGLKDTFGFMIFEGDIVECLGGEYYSGHYEISAIAQIENIRDMAMYNFLNAEKIEVVGNIHDNPELLEVK